MKYTKIWTKSYGNLLSKRAKSELPEMESSKSVSKKIKTICLQHDKILDVGCGVGHYYVSLKKRIKKDFEYVGIDIIDDYIKKAKVIFAQEKNVFFRKGDIFNIPFKRNSFDIVICNNFLHNLPSIQKSIQELLRVTKRYLLIRTLVGERSFRIQEVRNSEWDPNSKVLPTNEFRSNGEPVEYNFFNIYSKAYLENIIRNYEPKSFCKFSLDTTFNPKSIINSVKKEKKLLNATTVIGKQQLNGYVLMPWTFIEVWKNN